MPIIEIACTLFGDVRKSPHPPVFALKSETILKRAALQHDLASKNYTRRISKNFNELKFFL